MAAGEGLWGSGRSVYRERLDPFDWTSTVSQDRVEFDDRARIVGSRP